MAKPCTICTNPRAAEINAALGRDGPSAVVRAFGLPSKTTLLRHRDACLARSKGSPPTMAPASALAVVPAPDRAPTGNGRPGPGQPCAVCRSPVLAEIERRLCAGEPYLAIAREVAGAPSYDSVRRHARRCVPEKVRRARAEAGAADVASMAADLAALRDDALATMDDARSVLDDAKARYDREPANTDVQAFFIAAARTVGELTSKSKGVLELVGRLTGETQSSSTDIQRSAQWPAFVKAISEAVADCEVCSAAVEKALLNLDGRAVP